VLAICVNPDFPYACTDAWYRFPVVGVIALLNKVKLITGHLFDRLRTRGKCLVTVADPDQILHGKVYINIDIYGNCYLD